ncbi:MULTISPECIES: phage baseplate upper protein [unclassified Bacillus (in: firmicutes)]|uniref:phage baseplate upper protein n=1 Tax=unclassified Bacillus (in: firmicutes) TaxID=185979 RepID=UPI001BEADA70|nr:MULTISPECIES: phage baseplate upper protein [unclassified Bacillus (in: firmicutes)]MBT2615337.1 phage baseplate upper protein [Bacillus sp. ISL-78]MBT2628049.1 phage baseplate upper protein [Bacillus sp. ISL-101]
MVNEIFKSAFIRANVAATSNTTKTSIRFTTQDNGTAKLVFNINKDNLPLPLGSAATAKIFLRMADGSAFEKDATIIDPVNGQVEYILVEEINHPGVVKGEMNVYFSNGQSMTVCQFQFTIEKTLKDRDIVPLADYYVKDFESLKGVVTDQAAEVEQVLINTNEQLERLNEETGANIAVQVDTSKKDTEGVTHVDLPSRLNADFGKVTTQLAEKANQSEIMLDKKSLFLNSDFETLPYIESRSAVYQFTAGVTSPQYKEYKSLKIEAVGYEASQDPNKDFALILTEKILKSEKLKVSFMAYPLISGKTLNIRMAYGSGPSISLGNANQWNKIETVLDLTNITQENNYLYFNLLSSYAFYMSKLNISVENSEGEIEQLPISFMEINERLVENPSVIQNSNGIVERMINIGKTYLDKIAQFVYGNTYTAYDATQQLVGGKFQMDCSSFAHLIIHGIPFENSKYSGNTENKGSNLFFHNIDPYKYRFANQMGKYAFEKGYSFTPKADFSNVQAGDVLFFSWNNFTGNGDLTAEQREQAFMKIDHVAVFLHRKNDSKWATLQLDNGISTVFYDASNEYMSQCVLAARFPYANVESLYRQDNLVIDGDVPTSTTTTSTIGSYKLSEPLKKGRYYTMVVDGQINTNNGYFIIQTRTYQTIYSDLGKILPYQGVTELRFQYPFDEVTDKLNISIGAPGGTPAERSGNVNWCALYEGYVRDKKFYNKGSQTDITKNFSLDPTLVPDLETNYVPYYKYSIDGNKLFVNFSLPFKTLRTGSLVLGNIGNDAPNSTQRIPVNLNGASDVGVNGVLQINSSGVVSIIPYNNTVQWRYALANGSILRV